MAAPTHAAYQTLQVGSHGSSVKQLQNQLAAESYETGPIDGKFGAMTQSAVHAFERANGLAVDGAVTPAEFNQVMRAPRPTAPCSTRAHMVDVDIAHQLVYELDNCVVTHTMVTSTGGHYNYQENGQTYQANTPTGTFQIYSKVGGWQKSPLGYMYKPSYFTGGFALHGDTSVPLYPASHGCVRLPMYTIDGWSGHTGFYDRNPVGTVVHVY